MNRSLSSHSSYPYIYRLDDRIEGGGVIVHKILKNSNMLSKTEMDINAETLSNLFLTVISPTFTQPISSFYSN